MDTGKYLELFRQAARESERKTDDYPRNPFRFGEAAADSRSSEWM